MIEKRVSGEMYKVMSLGDDQGQHRPHVKAGGSFLHGREEHDGKEKGGYDIGSDGGFVAAGIRRYREAVKKHGGVCHNYVEPIEGLISPATKGSHALERAQVYRPYFNGCLAIGEAS